ncbi:MAG: amidohydrolase family protein [Gammaproteobacteria bacterium]|nr:amidohydrolase family protein [Gammaproteobacteria bacterium]
MSQFNIKLRNCYSPIVLLLMSLLLTGCSETPPDTPSNASSISIYEGALLIVGNGEVIENGWFTVQNGVISASGSSADMPAQENATYVDLGGMTVMPAIVDSHVHLSGTRDALIEDLQRRAGQGISAALSLGLDGLDTPLEIRDEIHPGAARYLSAGRGITAPEPGRSEVPHWVTTEEEARQAVRDEVANNVNFIKIWVDDRDGQFEKLGPELYGAVIDEAHQNGLKVLAHLFTLEDAKGLLRAGVDGFAHGVRDQDIDDEFIAMIQARPEVVLIPNLPGRGEATDLDWLTGTLPEDELTALQARNISRPDARDAFGIQARNLARLSAAGMRIAMGTDGNTFWAPHVEMEDMVISGMSPAEVIVAATRNSAELVGLDDLGTIEPGMSADFIVLAENPLHDITYTRRIVDVYLRGERVQP